MLPFQAVSIFISIMSLYLQIYFYIFLNSYFSMINAECTIIDYRCTKYAFSVFNLFSSAWPLNSFKTIFLLVFYWGLWVMGCMLALSLHSNGHICINNSIGYWIVYCAFRLTDYHQSYCCENPNGLDQCPLSKLIQIGNLNDKKGQVGRRDYWTPY